MMKCEEASRLSSEGLDRELTVSERFGLKFHLLMCKMCRTVTAQIAWLRRMASMAGDATSDSSLLTRGGFDDALSPEAKIRMKKTLSTDNS